MSFNCMDINASFLQMLKFGNSGEMVAGLSDFPKGQVLFKEQLSNILQNRQFKTAHSKSGGNILDKLISFVSEELQGLQGTDFLKKLKEFFMMLSGNDLSSLTLGAQGLDVLKELLSSAGFEIDQINALMDDLKLNITEENKNIPANEMMDKLVGLEWRADNFDEMEDPEKETVLPISAIPFIEAIMISLEIPEDIRKTILSDVKTDQGIDLNALIKNLKEFEDKSFASQTFFRTKDNTSVIKLLNQINLGNKTIIFSDGKLSLQGFINILENKKEESLNNVLAGTKDLNTKEESLNNVLAGTKDLNTKEILFVNAIKTIEPKWNQKSTLTMADFVAADTNGEKKIFDLIDGLFKSINKQDIDKNKIVNVPLNKFSAKDIDKLFPFQVKGQTGSDTQTIVKSELEEKFTRLLGKIESNMANMNGKNDSGSKNFFQKDRQEGSVKIVDSFQPTNGEGKVLNSVRYLSSAKKNSGRTLPSYVTNQIGRSIVRAVNQGQTELRLQLKPPELGRMMITIEDLGNGMKVSVVAENQTARDILLANSNSLRAALANSGVNLENFDVEMGSDFNNSTSDAKNQAGYSKNKKRQNIQGIDGDNMDIGNKALLREKHLTHDGVLYYVA
ncbi:MAG: flagellar hook-length control protein FliK [Desulfobacteraceae bacterium]|nr:flagellar hook-length control protein FliK [Desulfobacteraceae bacterium]